MEREIEKYAGMSELLGELEAEGSVSKNVQRSKQGDSMDEAKAKIVANIDLNIAKLQGQPVNRAPNILYTSLDAPRVTVGAKYGNYWLRDWLYINGQLCHFATVKPDKVVNALESLKAMILTGYADEEIERIQAINQQASLQRRGLA